jgi:hypothetical protein
MISLTTMTATSDPMEASTDEGKGAAIHGVGPAIDRMPRTSRTARIALAFAGAMVSVSLLTSVVFGMTAQAETADPDAVAAVLALSQGQNPSR